MLGEPEAVVAPALCVLCKVARAMQRLCGVAPGGDGGEIEDGERDHHGLLFTAARGE